MMQADLHAKEVRRLVRRGEISMAGNKALRIYGRLNCHSGKRMKKSNRVFFISEKEAVSCGFRPCGNCMRREYKQWLLARNAVS